MLSTRYKSTAAVLLIFGLAGCAIVLCAWLGYIPLVGEVRAAPVPAKGKKEAEKETEKEKRASELRDMLNKGFRWEDIEEDKTTTLDLVLEQLGKVLSVDFVYKERAFATDKVDHVDKTPVVETGPIRGGVYTLAVRLQKILSRIPAKSGATYMVRAEHIEITTNAAVRAELRLPANQPLLPLVWERFKKTPLPDTLDRLADGTDYSVVLDTRVRDKADKTEVSARLANVPVDVAVRVLADQAGLEVVRLANVFYVTSPENAARLRAADKRAKPAAKPALPARKPADKKPADKKARP
jgi:hypothetical protein